MGFLDRFRRGPGSDTAPVADTALLPPAPHPAPPLPPPPPAAASASVELERLAGGADRICVVDCETTGVYSTDRVVELAIVTLALDGSVLETWDTLIHPRRDVSATHIHGLTAEILWDAPSFADVVGDVALRLHGACLAAHNLPFDHRMLAGEFHRVDVDLYLHAGIDTLTATRCRLAVACATHGIDLEHAHSALADALATASLLRCVAADCQVGAPVTVPATLPRSGRVFPRAEAGFVPVVDPHHIAALAATLDHAGVEANTLAYLELVDRAVADLHLDAHERVELDQFARDLGLDDAHRAQAHRRLVNDLVDAALADHVVTAGELDVLLRVATALDVDPGLVEQRTRPARAASVTVRLDPRLEVVFTGDDPERPRETLIDRAEGHGLTVGKNVTKRTDLVIAYDPNSASGKAAKARSYGVPIVSTAQFAAARTGDQLDAHGSTVDTMKVVTCPDCHATWTVSPRSGAQSSRRCDDCAPLTKTTRPPKSKPAAPVVPLLEDLVCEACGRTWTRERKRGRKPSRCPTACDGPTAALGRRRGHSCPILAGVADVKVSREFVARCAAAYEAQMGSVESRLLDEVGPAVRARGFYEPDELAEAARWKTPRSRIAANPADDVRDITRLAFTAPERLQHRVLTLLAGVRIPTASALLAVVFPETHTIFDVRSTEALARLGCWDGTGGYRSYLDVCRRLADDVDGHVADLGPGLVAVEQGRLPDMSCDPARSYEPIGGDDLARLARLADAECDEFFARNPHLAHWRDRRRFAALAQGGADHYLRNTRGVWDLDVAVFFAQHPDEPPKPYLRRSVRSWDWGPSKFGRCPYDPPGYVGRAVDVALWVIPDAPDPIDGLVSWLEHRHATKKGPDLAHEPVVLVAPEPGRVVWDPPNVPPPVKTTGHRPPAGRAPA